MKAFITFCLHLQITEILRDPKFRHPSLFRTILFSFLSLRLNFGWCSLENRVTILNEGSKVRKLYLKSIQRQFLHTGSPSFRLLIIIWLKPVKNAHSLCIVVLCHLSWKQLLRHSRNILPLVVAPKYLVLVVVRLICQPPASKGLFLIYLERKQ